ncbi:hypothetical protein CsSME_00031989 [Camellia sinensis var. sinensis]
MPAQKRSHEEVPSEEDESLQRNQNQNENHHKHPQDVCESYGSPSSGGGDNNEFVVVKLSEIRKEVQCPICLGIFLILRFTPPRFIFYDFVYLVQWNQCFKRL